MAWPAQRGGMVSLCVCRRAGPLCGGATGRGPARLLPAGWRGAAGGGGDGEERGVRLAALSLAGHPDPEC